MKRTHILLSCLLMLIVVPIELSAQDPSAGWLSCELRGPDSVRFVDDRYVPDPFRVDVIVHNTGSDDIIGAMVYILSSARFTLLSVSSIRIDTLRAGQTVELTGTGTFLLKPVAADRSEVDTLSVLVDGDGSSSSCTLPIFIEQERRPRFALVCEAPDALQFDELLNDYVPNPFPVRTVLRNVGDGPAADCRIDFTGPSRITPGNGNRSIFVGRLEAGEEFTHIWFMQPGRRDKGEHDTLRFEAQGLGGIGGRVISTDCGSDVFIPAARAADYICTLEVDELRYDPLGKRYAPDPFMVRARVTNIGQGIAVGMTMETVLEDGLVLAPGQSPFDTLAAALDPGETAGPFVKSVRPLLHPSSDTLRIAVIFKDRFGNMTRCEKKVWIPAAEPSTLSLLCSSELDSLAVDPRTGNYVQSQFLLQAGVENTGDEPIYNVVLYAYPDPDGVLTLDPRMQERQITTALSRADGIQNASWTVNSRASSIDRIAVLRVLGIGQTATGQYLPLMYCDVPVFVPRVGEAQLECALVTSVTGRDDRVISFDTVRADYEGDTSRFGPYTVFRVTADIVNTGTAISSPVNVALLLPNPHLRLEEGETPTKTATPSEIPIGGRATVSWLVRPEKRLSDTTLTLELLISASQSDPAKCELQVELAKALHVVHVSIPTDLTGVSGGMLDVPVSIGASPGMEPGAYQFLLRFDPSVLQFAEARSEGTLTEYNWRHLNARVLQDRPYGTPDVLLVADSTRFTPEARSGETKLVRLLFTVIDRGGVPAEPEYIVRSALEFIRYPSMMADGSIHMPFVRPFDSTGGKRLTPVFHDGEAILSGECVLPLSASTRLFPNRPNPFNPVTLIPYYLSEATAYRLVLLDSFGREIRILEQGQREAGHHQFHFDARELPSGVYFCRLETAGVRHLQRLLLVK